MKRYNYLLMATMMLSASCVRTDNAYLETPRDISFQPVISTAGSRAGNDFVGTSFGATTWLGINDGDINTQVYFDDVEIKRSASSSYWEAHPTQYWPGFGFLDFFCYSPYGGIKPTINVSYFLAQNTLEYPELTVDGSTPDLLYSDKTINQTDETMHQGGVGVPIIFNHALAKVVVTVTATMLREDEVNGEKGDWWTIKLTEFTLSNIKNKGSVKMLLDQDKKHWQKPSPTAVWTPTPGSTVTFNLKPEKGTEVADTIRTEAQTYLNRLVLPQTLADNAMLHIKYDLTTHHPDGKEDNKWVNEINIPLNQIQSAAGAGITSWEMNKVISYHILITPPSKHKPLIFRPVVDDWTTSPQPLPDISPNDKNN